MRSRHVMSRTTGCALVVSLAMVASACSTPAPTTRQEELGTPVPTRPPVWLGAPADVKRAADLEEAAALLCARDTDGVIDDDARHATGLWDAQVVGVLRRASTRAAAQAALAADAAGLLAQKRATHAGVAVGQTTAGEACAALVGARRLVEVGGPRLRGTLPRGAALEVTVRLAAGQTAALFTLKPDGFVTRVALDGGRAHTLSLAPVGGEGRYIAELVVDRAEGPSDPEVAFVWPWVVGAPRDAPFPEVLFPDEGHDDAALTHRTEALLQRLRNEQLLEPFKLSPALAAVAQGRARAVADRGALGHRVPGAHGTTNAQQDLKERFGEEPRAQFVRLAEVQAQASTLAEAWRALLDSPAHRHALVESAFTHAGAAVVRGQDAAGRPMVSLVALVARRPPQRDLDAVRARFLETANEARAARGLDLLEESAHLHRVALRLAGAMKDHRRLDDTLLGGPVGQVALEADASFTRVKPLVARTEDPLLLVQNGPPPLLLELDATRVGLGIALDPTDGGFYVVILAGE